MKCDIIVVTTAENAIRALEYLGLGDQDQHIDALTNNVSKIYGFFFPLDTSCRSENHDIDSDKSMKKTQKCIFFLQDLKVNLIITDYCMPGMTGFELLKKVKVITTITTTSWNQESHVLSV